MTGLPTSLLARAFRIYFAHAYPDGGVPPAPHRCAAAAPEHDLASLLEPPVCQPVRGPDGDARGYFWRLGSVAYPHLKLQLSTCGAEWVFAVDTHDGMKLPAGHPDAARWAHIREANSRLKEEIEGAWEEAGLLTFNALLRRGLE
jgi:hypothetical protein